MPIHALFEEAPQNSYKSDLVGRCRSGMKLNNRMVSLPYFRFTTGDPVVAEKIAHLFGGEPAKWETSAEDNIEVITETNFLKIKLNSLQAGNILWTGNGVGRECDGITQKDGHECFCKKEYENLKSLKIAQEKGLACGPQTKATFTIDADPDIGIWNFISQSKTLAKGDPHWTKAKKEEEGEIFSPPINEIEEMFLSLNRSAEATLQLVGVSYTNSQGQPVSYTKPVLLITDSDAAQVAA
jgi:hypothetical protein